ncbi:hypothetical protein DPMN_039505 [Dreissena polymorpha]|uniref:Gamma-glutamylcyclotransferase n=1 Tax=Dreissena polymorpha TaxID=45954 RepID=A0A9D4CTD1_DREPO|nr:hypothetical protein DPMN_039505 [Dreissena polymorpha]
MSIWRFGYGNILLRSSLFLDACSTPNTYSGVVDHERAGPSIPVTWKGVLHAGRIGCQTPPLAVISHRFRGSEFKHMGWRICFNTGETELQQIKWVVDITDMMAECPMAIMRLPKIRQAVVASPEPMLWFSKIRMELEILYLDLWNRCTKCSSEKRVVDEYNDILQEIERRMGN